MSMRVFKIGFILLGLLCFTSAVSSSAALVAGILLSLSIGNPFGDITKVWTSRCLQIAIVGLGAGMNLEVVGKVGTQGLGYTAFGIMLTFVAGKTLGNLLEVNRTTSVLITAGTAICGGSAIAAVAPAIRAKSHETSVALAVVFVLNAIALVIFPGIGHIFNLTEAQFGLWSALAIHDTSSVVGAAVQYGPEAAEIATTVKLARALWIVPVSLAIGLAWNRKAKGETQVAAKRPWFILGFLVAAALVTWIPSLGEFGHWVNQASKHLLTFTLFLIGAGLTRESLKQVGLRPLLQGVCLWGVMASSTLLAIVQGWIH